MKLIEIQYEINDVLQQIDPDIFFEDFLSTERGDRKIRGRHVAVNIPLRVKITQEIKNIIDNLFEKHYGDVKKIVVEHGTTRYSGSRPCRVIRVEFCEPFSRR